MGNLMNLESGRFRSTLTQRGFAGRSNLNYLVNKWYITLSGTVIEPDYQLNHHLNQHDMIQRAEILLTQPQKVLLLRRLAWKSRV